MMERVFGTRNEEHSRNPGAETDSAAKAERASDGQRRKGWSGKAKAMAGNLRRVLGHRSNIQDQTPARTRMPEKARGRLRWRTLTLTWASAQTALLIATAATMLGALAPSATAQGVVDLPRNWRLTPGEINIGEEFRVMFVTSTTTEANSDDIAVYNNFVQTRAASGHSEIRQFASGFRVIGSTSAVEALDNTSSTYTAADKGAPIYWVNAGRIATDYEDFYDGSWATGDGPRNERGALPVGTGKIRVNTGTNNNGTRHIDHLGRSGNVRVGALRSPGLSPLSETSTTREARTMYALSPVLRLMPIAMPISASIVSTPQQAKGYGRGEQIRVEVDFGEPIQVHDPPYIVLDVGGTARRANYASGSGTRRLVFAYTVAHGERDTNGVALCVDETKDPSCGRIAVSSRTAIVSAADHNRVGVNLPALGNQPAHKVNGVVDVDAVTVTSTPASATTYNAGETIVVQLDFGEAVSVTGTPYVTLDIGGRARRAAYASGSGTRYATFEYTVGRGDYDADGIALCATRTLDPGCARLALAGGAMRAVSDRVAVELALPTLNAQSGHRVDGSPGPTTPPMGNPGSETVPHDWPLRPEGVTGPFRLLFVTSTGRNAESTDINDYNNHVISAAGAGHTEIQAYKNGFRAIASTEAVDARDNAGLTGTGVPIYWLDGEKVADDYADLLDGSWDNETWKTEAGGAGNTDARTVWTGSNSAGTEKFTNDTPPQSLALGTTATTMESDSESGRLNGGGNPLTGRRLENFIPLPLYGLSQVLDAATGPKYDTTQITSEPRAGRTYREGETIRISVSFTEDVVVRGVPTLALNLAGTAQAPGAGMRAMRYARGSGSETLYFEYIVQTGDFTGGGTTPLTISANAGESPITLAGATIRSEQNRRFADLTPPGTEAFLWTSPENHRVEARGPTVTHVGIISSPASGGRYVTGETIEVHLTTSEQVRVTGTPYIEIDMSGNARRAHYVGRVGRASTNLEFGYTVLAHDYDADGIGVRGNIRFNGGSIRSADDPRRLRLTASYAGLESQVEHRVNARSPAPTGTTSSGCSGTSTVPGNWQWIPTGVGRGDRFRLLFVTMSARNGASSDINVYNRWVQDQAGAGPTTIRAVKTHFRALASTEAVDARDNACVSGTGGDKIYWLNGEKVADDNADFSDGSLDSTRQKTQSGTDIDEESVLTGSTAAWVEWFNSENESYALGNSANDDVTGGEVAVGVYSFAEPNVGGLARKGTPSG